MKKILTVSLVAMMSVTAANAQIASKAYVDSGDGNYVSADNTAGENILALDTQVKANTDKLPDGETTVADAIATALQNANVATAIQGVQKNGTDLTPVNGVVNVTVPTGALASLDAVAESNLASELATKINGKADAADLGALAALDEVAESNLASALATKINGKADAATTLAGYGITDAYTKTEANGAFVEAPATALTPASGNNLVSYDAQGLVTGGVAAGTMATANTADYYNKTDIGTIDSGKTLVQMISDASSVSNFIDDSITDGVANKAPSENAVHDALALKANTADLGTMAAEAAGDYTKTEDLADIALSGNYSDLTVADGAIAQSKVANLGTAASADVADSIAQNGTGLATAGQVYTAVANAQTASVANLDLAADAQSQGTGNVIVSVSQSDGQLAATKGYAINTVNAATGNGNVISGIAVNATNANQLDVTTITAIPKPSGSCTDCVLHFDGTDYSWEEIARAE